MSIPLWNGLAVSVAAEEDPSFENTGAKSLQK